MDGKFYLTEKFKALNAKWAEKLKESGFEEIEDIDPTLNKEPFLKLWHSTYFFNMYSIEEVAEQSNYYRMADEFYWRYAEFQNDLHREAWRLHAEGFSRRKIAQILKRGGHKISADSIQIIVSGLKKIMQTHDWPVSEKAYERKSDSKDRLPSLPRLSPRR